MRNKKAKSGAACEIPAVCKDRGGATIFALSSGALPSGVAIIRLSGGETRAAVEAFCGFAPPPRQMALAQFKGANGEILDKGLAVYFPAPHSFTGEDCAEFHLHGSKALIRRMLAELAARPNCRQAEAGEFARRAFANGKIDLTEAEGLADLLAAETESQRKLAMQGASGALKALYRGWRRQLIALRAQIEAELDFAEEEDVAGAFSPALLQKMAELAAQLRAHCAGAEQADIMRDGLKIVLAGAPNAGKSSFLNRLSGRAAALVNERAGTTRDALEVRLIIENIPVLLTDTAGLRRATDEIEQLGVELAKERVKEADLVLYLADMQQAAAPADLPPLPPTKAEIWRIGNKVDLSADKSGGWDLSLSAKTGQGWEAFMARLRQFCRDRQGEISAMLPARGRQLHLLREAATELDKARAAAPLDLELRAEHLRYASDALGRITGDINVEDVLDVIFSEFCIGK